MTAATNRPRAQQCLAKSPKIGERCRAYAMTGGLVCYWHGRMAPQVRKKAQGRAGVITHLQRLTETQPLRDLGDQSRTYSPQAGKPLPSSKRAARPALLSVLGVLSCQASAAAHDKR